MRVVIEPYVGCKDITKSNTTIIAPTRGIMAAVTGDIAVKFVDGSTTIFVDVVAGHVYPISVIQVLETGTDATGIVALY